MFNQSKVILEILLLNEALSTDSVFFYIFATLNSLNEQ